jgi:hypothetical protein
MVLERQFGQEENQEEDFYRWLPSCGSRKVQTLIGSSQILHFYSI